MADVRFTVLGRVALQVDGADVQVRGRRERSVLAALLAARGQEVSVDRLLDEVWAGGGPVAGAGSQGSLQVAISHLRALVEPDRAPRAAPTVLVRGPQGYSLRTVGESVDSERFTTLVERGHAALAGGAAELAAELCDEGIALWTGSPFGGAVDGDLVRAEVSRLEDLYLSARELRAEARLALGEHALVTGELEGLVAAHPFRERLRELHALSLYRCGRQSDALAALRSARQVLADELGIDPGPALQALEADVLAQSPHLVAVPVRPRGARPPSPRYDDVVPERGHRPAPPAVGTDGATLFGRSEALERLTEVLTAAAGGTGSTVVISGEPGIGKTRLVGALERMASDRGARVVWGRCHEADVAPAFWPWVPVLRELADAHLSKEVAELLEPSGASASADAASSALRTYDAVARLIAGSSTEGLLVVVLEDLHWADSSSLKLLAYVAQALGKARVLLVVTLRDTEDRDPALQTCLAALGRLSPVRVPLTGLTSAQVHELISALLGGSADHELAAVVAERTDGNPFFVLELVRLLHAEGRLDADGARRVDVPHGVKDVLRLRLGKLPEPVRRILGIAAVIGRDVDLDVVAQVAGSDRDEVLDLLDQAVASHAVDETARPGHYRFSHALVRETLASTLSRARRGRLHAVVARVLEPRLSGQPDLLPEVAHHFVAGAAIEPELAGPAVGHAMAAARQAESRDAMDEALHLWEQALSADALAPVEDLRRRYAVLLGLGRARYRRGAVAGSREALDAAVDLGRRLDDVALVAEAATSFRGAGVWDWREFGTSDPAMVAVLRECVRELPTGALHARALASLAMELMYEWRSQEADIFGARAVEVARTVADEDLLADVVALRTLALWGRPGAAEERLALADEVLALHLTPEQELYTRFGAAAAHRQRGDTGQADREMTRCIELARRLRHTGADVPIAWWRFHRAVDTGDLDGAAGLGREALERHRRSEIVAVSDMEPMVRFRLAGAGAPVSDDDVALARRHANPAFRALVAHVLAEAGRADEALDLLGDAVPDGAWDYASMFGDCLRVDVLAAAGQTEGLAAALDRISPWGHEFAVYGSTDCIGSIDYFIGRGLEGLGDRAGAAQAYRRAAERNAEAGIVTWHERAVRRLAAMAGG